MTAQIDVSADTAEAVAEIDSVDATPVEVEVTADVAPAEGEIDSLEAAPVEVVVEADTSSAEAQVEALGDASVGASEGVGGLTESLGGLGEAQGGVSTGAAGLAGTLSQGGSSALVAATGYGAVAAGAYELIGAFGEAQSVGANTDLIIRNTGSNANVTAGEVAGLASEIQGYAGFSDEAVASGANFVLGLQNVRNEAGEGNDVFSRLIRISADYAAFTGGEVTSATQKFGRALNDPVRGMSLLRRSGVLFTAEQQELVTSLVETGDVLGAQRVLLDSLEERYQGAGRTFGETIPGQIARTKEAFGELAESAGGVLAPAFSDLIDQGGLLVGVLDQVGGAIGDIPGIGAGELVNAGSLLPFQRERQILEGAISGTLGGTVVDDGSETLAVVEQAIADVEAAEAAATEAGGELAGSLGDVGAEAEKSARTVDDLRSSLDELDGTQRTVDEGAITVRDNQRALLESLTELEGGYRAGSVSGDAFIGTARQLATSVREQTLAVLANGQGADAARLAQAGYTQGLRQVLEQAGLTDAEINELIRTYARVPEEEITRFETPGLPGARAGAQGLKLDIDRIPNRKDITLAVTVTGLGEAGSAIAGLADDVTAATRSGNVAVSRAEAAVAPRAVGESARGGDTIIIDVDARGAQDPRAVGAAVTEAASALASHRRTKNIKLNMRSG